MDKNTIINLMHFNTENISNKKVIINDKYVCKFWSPELKDGETYVFFTEWYNDKNCPRSSCYADVFVGDNKGRIYIHNDHDLGESSAYTVELVIFNGNKVELGTVAISCKILDN